jgi:hypothetical protein
MLLLRDVSLKDAAWDVNIWVNNGLWAGWGYEFETAKIFMTKINSST